VTGRIIIERPRGVWRDIARQYNIKVDGEMVGKISRGTQLAVDVAPGSHRVQARIDWTGSQVLDVDVADDSEVHITVEPAGNSLQLLYQTFTRYRYLRLRVRSGSA
jgi:hypothetical protein